MTGYSKGPAADDDRAPKTTNHKDDFTATVAELAKDGWILQEGQEFDDCRDFIHMAMIVGDSFAKLRVLWDQSEGNVKQISAERGGRCSFLVIGWDPQVRLGAEELTAAVGRIYNGDLEQVGIRDRLRDKAKRAELLLDPRFCREMAQSLDDELTDRGTECEQIFNHLAEVQNLRGAIPKSALIFLMQGGGGHGDR